ncbi:expressed unknown protein [Seminavis robusta]|uniref:Uncharacterized protein n=1 Tax=Seminavis robusta TaxID=568900 RepID=A0A9N8DJX6_9STRA|nr:expressed unknown protein [Seminavis robusta]|eukprot:Sro163_g073040.1 n/a (265) ;mRNA; f:9906-10873
MMTWMPCVSSAENAGTIQLTVLLGEFGDTTPLQGANVKCYDQDGSERTPMTSTVTTDMDGVAKLDYTIKHLSFYKKGKWDSGFFEESRNPDIICKVSSPAGAATPIISMFTDTQWDRKQEALVDLGTIVVAPDRIKRGDVGDANGCGPAFFPATLNRLAEEKTGMGVGCSNHDYCYGNCKGETQKSCDDEARRIWRSECERKLNGETTKTICKEGLAEAMYMAVTSSAGTKAFKADQEKFCGGDDDEYDDDDCENECCRSLTYL